MIKIRIAAKALFLLMLMGGALQVDAQDSLKVMTYNLLRYGADGIGGCTPTGVTARNPWFTPIMNELRPDIFGVNEVGPTNAANSPAANILLNILQPINPAYKRTNVTFNNGQDIANGMFYNSDKVELLYQAVIPQGFRNIDYYKFYYLGPGLAQGDTTYIEVVQVHFSASDANIQLVQAQTIMNYLNAFGRPGNFIVMGDMNLNSANSAPFQAMVAYGNPDCKMNDPINLTGSWSNNTNARHAWSQSTRNSSGGDCGSGGGLDDRFDIILCSNSLMNNTDDVRYKPGTYWIPGNPNAPNRGVPSVVSSSLVPMSDHHPVLLTLEVDQLVSTARPQARKELIEVLGQPAGSTIQLRLGGEGGLSGPASLELLDIRGQLLRRVAWSDVPAGMRVELPVAGIPEGIYLLHLKSNGQQPDALKKVLIRGY